DQGSADVRRPGVRPDQPDQAHRYDPGSRRTRVVRPRLVDLPDAGVRVGDGAVRRRRRQCPPGRPLHHRRGRGRPMMGTPIYAETFQDAIDAAIADDNEELLEILEQMDKETTP